MKMDDGVALKRRSLGRANSTMGKMGKSAEILALRNRHNVT